MTLAVTDREALRNVAPGEYVGREVYGSNGVMTELAALIDADRVAYGARFQTLCGELRDPDRVGRSGAVVYTDTGLAGPSSAPWRGIVYGLCVRLPPDTLPGSTDVWRGSGGTAATRGALRLWTWSSGAEWVIRVRRITVDGADSVLGVAVSASIAADPAMAWRSVDVMLPDGIDAGDDIAIDVLCRCGNDLGGGVYTMTWRAWSVMEIDLSEVDGDPDVSMRTQGRLSDYVDIAVSAATLTSIPVTAWDAIGAYRTAFMRCEIAPGAAAGTVHVLRASTLQTVAPLGWQVPATGGWVSPIPIERSQHQLYSATATTVRVWFDVITGGV